MEKDDNTWLRVAYVCFALIVGFTATKFFNTVGIESGWAERYDDWYPLASSIGSVLLGLGTFFYLGRDAETKDYHLNAIAELRKVTWPSFEDTQRMTIIVVVVVGVFSAILTLFDIAWSNILGLILS